MDAPQPMPKSVILPFPKELTEPTDPDERERQLCEAEAEIEAGHFNTHEEVRKWLSELVAGRDIPPPCDR
jgi:hypothetical protein